MLLQNSKYSCVTTLSILVIVNFSVTATCSFVSLWPRNWAFHGHDCRNAGHAIVNLELCAERHWS